MIIKTVCNQIICHQNPAAINVVLLFRNFALSNRELISVENSMGVVSVTVNIVLKFSHFYKISYDLIFFETYKFNWQL